MWQSRVEIEDYSVVYFNRIVAFEVPYRWTSVKGGAHTRFIDVWISHESTKHVWALPLTEAQQYGASKATMWLKYAIEICNRITFDFYTGLPHIHFGCVFWMHFQLEIRSAVLVNFSWGWGSYMCTCFTGCIRYWCIYADEWALLLIEVQRGCIY